MIVHKARMAKHCKTWVKQTQVYYIQLKLCTHIPALSPELNPTCPAAASNKRLLRTHVHAVIKWIWIGLVRPSNSARHLALPEVCNNLYRTGLSAPRPQTVASGRWSARKLMGRDEKEMYPQINGPQNGAMETNFKPSDAFRTGCFISRGHH